MKSESKRTKRIFRHKRVRAKVSGTAKRPRLSVFRSHKNVLLQLIDDAEGKTLVAVSTKDAKGSKSERAGTAATKLAEAAKAKGISVFVFDRGGNKYHGRIKAIADAVRKAGISV